MRRLAQLVIQFFTSLFFSNFYEEITGFLTVFLVMAMPEKFYRLCLRQVLRHSLLRKARKLWSQMSQKFGIQPRTCFLSSTLMGQIYIWSNLHNLIIILTIWPNLYNMIMFLTSQSYDAGIGLALVRLCMIYSRCCCSYWNQMGDYQGRLTKPSSGLGHG